MKKKDIAVIVSIICVVTLTIILVLQSNYVDKLENELKLAQNKYENSEQERKALEAWVEEDEAKIKALEAELAEIKEAKEALSTDASVYAKNNIQFYPNTKSTTTKPKKRASISSKIKTTKSANRSSKNPMKKVADSPKLAKPSEGGSVVPPVEDPPASVIVPVPTPAPAPIPEPIPEPIPAPIPDQA